jgi:dTDP-4-amino-4,6-dideoxygalactose transaminase
MNATGPIPVFDLKRVTTTLRDELEARWGGLLDTLHFVGGNEVAEFEERFAAFQEVPECVGVANGTDALMLALKALGMQPGDEVIVPAFTFIATAGAVSWLGGKPVFADVEEETLNIDVQRVAEKINAKTVGVIGVHLYGRPCAARELRSLCSEHGIWFLEDAAQAHGARLGGKRVGSFGELTTWSFYPSKNLGCFGDGGAVSGLAPDLLVRVRKLANHGRSQHYFHDQIGVNSRLDALQAAVLNCRLPKLARDNDRRREIARKYSEGLAGIGQLRLLRDDEDAKPVYHLYTIMLEEREELRSHLESKQIGSAVHYPHSLVEQPAFSSLALAPGDCPVARRAATEVLCLPMFPELGDGEIERVCSEVQAFFA